MQSPASSGAAPWLCSLDLPSFDAEYFDRTVLDCVMKGSSPFTLGIQRHKSKSGSHNVPVRDISPWGGLQIFQESLNLMGWTWHLPQWKQEQLPSSRHRSERDHWLSMGQVAGCRGRTSGDWTRYNTAWVREGIKVMEMEGSNWSREERVWENRGKRGSSSQSHLIRLLAGVLVFRSCSRAMGPGEEICEKLLARRWPYFTTSFFWQVIASTHTLL